jgi:hypothetical protein
VMLPSVCESEAGVRRTKVRRKSGNGKAMHLLFIRESSPVEDER